MTDLQFLIITGMSGAGKSVAMRLFEDLGFFCVDNLPPALISKFAELCTKSEGKINQVALVIDIRGGSFFNDLAAELVALEKEGVNFQILFLEASNEALVNRYKESRRRHPLTNQGSILDAINEERSLLGELRGKASKVLDTTNLSLQNLKDQLQESFIHREDLRPLSISLVSFGFKYGLPIDADLVFDLRFLPNPNYVQSLKEFTGKDEPVLDFIFKWPLATTFSSKLFSLISFLLPQYSNEGKSHLKIAIGCTGGRHRSVAFVERLYAFLEGESYPLHVEHRDIERKDGYSSGSGGDFQR